MAVDAYPGEDFTGAITKISPVLDSATRSVPIEITVSNADHRLKSGMYAKARLIIAQNAKMAVVPKEALVGRGDSQFVFVVRDGKAEMRTIKVAVRQGSQAGLSEGVSEGDMVVIMGQQRLSDGIAVHAEEWS